MKKSHDVFLKTGYKVSNGIKGNNNDFELKNGSEVRLTKRTLDGDKIIEEVKIPFRTFTRSFLYEMTRNLTEEGYNIGEGLEQSSINTIDSTTLIEEILTPLLPDLFNSLYSLDNLNIRESSEIGGINDHIGIVVGTSNALGNEHDLKKLEDRIENSAGTLVYEGNTKIIIQNNSITFKRRFQNYSDVDVEIGEIGLVSKTKETIEIGAGATNKLGLFLLSRDVLAQKVIVEPDTVIEIDYIIKFFSASNKTFTSNYIKFLQNKFEDRDINGVSLKDMTGTTLSNIKFDNATGLYKSLMAAAGVENRGILIGNGTSIGIEDNAFSSQVLHASLNHEDTLDSINGNEFYSEYPDGNSGFFTINRRFVNRTAAAVSVSQAGLVIQDDSGNSFLIAKWSLKDDTSESISIPVNGYLEVSVTFVVPYIDL